MCKCLSVFALKIIIGLLNIPIFLYGAGIIVPMVIMTSVGNSDVREELKLGNPTIVGIIIGCLAIATVILFCVISYLVCLPDICIRILVLLYCGFMVFKIIFEIVFLVKISMVQSSMNEALERYFVNAILKAGGQDELAKKDLTYEQFQALPNATKSNFECNNDCEINRKLVDDIQSKMKCCGIKSPNDWYKVRTNVPESCCVYNNCKVVRKDGCMEEVEDLVKKIITILMYIVIVAMGLQIVCITFGYLLYKALKLNI